jgi:hypothetical protein
MYSTAQTASRDLGITNETASMGDAWIVQRKQPVWDLDIIKETASTGDAWIQQHK